MEDYLPPGFRFYPTEEELLSFYLHTRLEGGRDDLNRAIDRIIPVLDIYQFDPWDLPQFAGEVSKSDREQWFFFVPRQESEARGGRPKRLTSSGYWKATGTTSYVYSSNNRIIGMKRTMVFYNGRAPTGTKTDWKMNEYKPIHAAGDPSSSSSSAIPLLSLCRIYKKTKSLRAFDRRPRQAPEMAQLPTEQLPSQHNVGDALPHQNPNPPLMGERASSPEYSSSSGDQADAHLISHTTTGSEPTNMQSSEMDVDTNDELVWDWNHLNWL